MKKLILVILSLMCFNLIIGQTPITLELAIEKAISNSLDIEIAKVNYQIAANNNTWKAAGQHPTISSSLSNNNILISQDNPTSFLGKASILNNSLDANIDVGVSLYDGGRIKINKRLFQHQALLADNAVQQNIETVIQSVLSAYYQAQILKEQLKTFDEILILSEDRVAYQNVRKEFGQAGTFDLLQSQDALLNDSTNYLVIQNSYQTAIRSLKLAMGEIGNDEMYDIVDPLSYDIRSISLEEVSKKVLEKNTLLQALQLNRDLALAQVDLQKSVKKPLLNLNTGLNASLSGSDLFGSSDFAKMINYTLGNSYGPYANLTARYTIYDGDNMQRNIDNAVLDEQIAKLSLENQERTIRTQTENAIANYFHHLELIQLTQSLLDNARRNLLVAEERFKAAQINSFDYRAIQLSYVNANLTKLNSIFNLKMAEMEIDRLSGDLITYQE